MRCQSLLLPLIFTLAFLPSAAAQLVTITFDEAGAPPGMSNTPGATIPAASQLSTQYISQRVTFSSPSWSFVPVVALGVNHAVSGTRAIGAANSAGALTYASANPIVITFGTATQPGITDYISVRGDLLLASGVNRRMALFGVNNDPMGTIVLADTTGQPLVFSGLGVHRIELTGSTSETGGVGYDDLQFNLPNLCLQFTTGQPRVFSECNALAIMGVQLATVVAASTQWQRFSPASGTWQPLYGSNNVPAGARPGIYLQTQAAPKFAGRYRLQLTAPCATSYSEEFLINVCAGDFDCSGVRTVGDIFAFLTAWFQSSQSADYDGNGTAVSDIFAFLSAWFAGC